MRCAKCGQENPAARQYCGRCHYPLRFTCPSCKHQQERGGQCERCGTDFAKFAAGLLLQAQSQAEAARQAGHRRHSALRRIALAILTGGLSLLFSRPPED
ncbi:MAG TPA: hypothetical protein VNN17_11150 [Terriglobia bacterium]|nr:hypothetical protein [Terriglobia bacterium]